MHFAIKCISPLPTSVRAKPQVPFQVIHFLVPHQHVCIMHEELLPVGSPMRELYFQYAPGVGSASPHLLKSIKSLASPQSTSFSRVRLCTCSVHQNEGKQQPNVFVKVAFHHRQSDLSGNTHKGCSCIWSCWYRCFLQFLLKMYEQKLKKGYFDSLIN